MKTKAIFLDRDGVINNPGDNYYVWKQKDFKINKHIYSRLKEYSIAGYLLILISNQGGISKGVYKKSDTEKLHSFFAEKLSEHNIEFAEMYFCPHHSDIENCICRKPDSLLIEKAVAKFNISTGLSYFIGDSKRDIQAAEKAGIKGVLIQKNAELPEIK